MTMIDPGDSYVGSVLPAVIVFGLGLTLVVAPITATGSRRPMRHAGVASNVNNAVARTAGLAAVAAAADRRTTGADYEDPAAMTDAFHGAVLACAVLALAGVFSRG